MTRKMINWCVRVVGLLVAGLVILGFAAVWRLSSGPVSLDFLTPEIEAAVNPAGSPYTIAIGETELVWAGWERAIDIVVRDVAIDQPGAVSPVAWLPSVSIGLSMRAAAEGRVNLTSLDIIEPAISLSRQADGTMSMTVGDGTERGEDSGAALAAFEMLRGPLDENEVLGGVRRVSILGGRITLVDEASDTVWNLADVALNLTRSDHVLFATLRGGLETVRGRAALDMTAQITHGDSIVDTVFTARDLQLPMIADLLPGLTAYRLPGVFSLDLTGEIDLDRLRHEGQIKLRTEFGRLVLDGMVREDVGSFDLDGKIEGLTPSKLAKAQPALKALEAVDAPVSLTFSATGTIDGVLERGAIEAKVGEGRLIVPALLPNPIPLSKATAAATLTDAGAIIVLEHLWMDLKGPQAQMSGEMLSAAGGNGQPERSVRLDASLLDMTLDRLEGLWPPALAVDARDWMLRSMPAATVHQTRMSASGMFSGDGFEHFTLLDLDGEMAFEGAVVDYLPPMAPATGVAGYTNFDETSFNIQAHAGSVGDIIVETGDIRITGLNADKERIDIDLELDTPIVSALELLNTDPYLLVDDLGLDLANLSGDAAVMVKFGFPLLLDLKASDVEFDAIAGLGDVRMPLGDIGAVLTADSLNLSVENEGLELAGPIKVDDVPATVVWRESFQPSVDPPRKIRVVGDVPVGQLSNWGVKTFDIAAGRIRTVMDYSLARSRSERVQLSADLVETALQLPNLGFEKPVGEAGLLTFDMTIPQTGPIDIVDLRLATGDLAVAGSVSLAEGFEGLVRGQIDSLSWGHTQMAVTATRTETGGYRFDAIGPFLDLGAYFEDDEADSSVEEPVETEPGPEVAIVAAFDTVVAGPERRLSNVKIDLRHDGLHIDKLLLDASVGKGEMLKIAYWPGEDGRHDLRVSSGDAGQAMRALDWTDRITGGVLELSGVRNTPDGPLEGQINVDNFTLTRVPVLAKLLEFMSLTGILSALSESGLAFDKLEGRFTYLDGALKLLQGRAYGSSIGITARGTADINSTELDVEGTIAPMYTISRLLENIPIINIITGGKEGIFGANFSVRGPAQDAEISVNPLSALAPGFLRTLFNQLPKSDAKPADRGDALAPSSDR